MRSAAECIDKAIGLEGLAMGCVSAAVSADLLGMASQWRRVALQAAWQDKWASAGLEVGQGPATRP